MRTEKKESGNAARIVLSEHLQLYIYWLSDYLTEKGETHFTNAEIYQTAYKSEKTIRNYHKQLLEKEMLQIVSINRNLGYTYSLLV